MMEMEHGDEFCQINFRSIYDYHCIINEYTGMEQNLMFDWPASLCPK